MKNIGGGVMVWSARVEYKSGSGWVRISPTSGLRGNTIRLHVIPMSLAVGTYESTLILDAGPAGVARYPVTLEVKPLPLPVPVVSSIGGAATFTEPLTRGGLATIEVSNLAGANVSVTFDRKPARFLYAVADQIKLQAPYDLTGGTAPVVVMTDGVVGASGIFPGGILHQDNRVNTPETPARSPSIAQISATGVLPAQGRRPC